MDPTALNPRSEPLVSGPAYGGCLSTSNAHRLDAATQRCPMNLEQLVGRYFRLNQELLTAGNEIGAGDEQSLIEIHEALDRLALLDERQAQIVECRFFAGYNEADTALALGISDRTVRRDWIKARAWLRRELAGDDATPQQA